MNKTRRHTNYPYGNKKKLTPKRKSRASVRSRRDRRDRGALPVLRHVPRYERVHRRERDALTRAEQHARRDEGNGARRRGPRRDESGQRPSDHSQRQDSFAPERVREPPSDELSHRVAVEERGEHAAGLDLIPSEVFRHRYDGGGYVRTVGVTHEDRDGCQEGEGEPVVLAVAAGPVSGLGSIAAAAGVDRRGFVWRADAGRERVLSGSRAVVRTRS